jgi:hypothetical protein
MKPHLIALLMSATLVTLKLAGITTTSWGLCLAPLVAWVVVCVVWAVIITLLE